jgi:hypothetical protein
MPRAPLPACLLAASLVFAGTALAQDRDKALAKAEVATRLRQAQLHALDRELDSVADPGLAATQAVLLIADWGRQADDVQPAVTALGTIAEAAKGTPVGRLALLELGKLLAEKKRQAEGIRVLTRLAVEAVSQAGPSAQEAGGGEARRLKEWDAQLRAKEAALTAQSRQVEEEAERLKEYALALKAEQEKLQATQGKPGAEQNHPLPSPPPVGEREPASPMRAGEGRGPSRSPQPEKPAGEPR